MVAMSSLQTKRLLTSPFSSGVNYATLERLTNAIISRKMANIIESSQVSNLKLSILNGSASSPCT